MSEIWIPSPNYSSRGGASVRLITVHTSEGATDGYSLGNFLANPSSQVSYHAGVDNKRQNTVFRYVDDSYKSWAQANYNPVAVTGCFCTPTGASNSWSRDYWINSQGWMLDSMAQWVKSVSDRFGIPLVELSSSQAQGSGKGVCQHANLGAGGSNHSDCGLGRFPMDVLLQKAGGAPSQPPSEQPPSSGSGDVPTLHVDYFGPAYGHNSEHSDVGVWQGQMQHRGWSIDTDSIYGPASENVCRQFQHEKGLNPDGLVGPKTWAASWTAPIT